MTVGDAMVINIPSGFLGIRNMGFAKQPRRPSNPVLPYCTLERTYRMTDILYVTSQWRLQIRACRHLSTFIESFSGRILVPLDINNNYVKEFLKNVFKMCA